MATPYGYFHSYFNSITRAARYCKRFCNNNLGFPCKIAQNRIPRRRNPSVGGVPLRQSGSLTILTFAVTASAALNVML